MFMLFIFVTLTTVVALVISMFRKKAGGEGDYASSMLLLLFFFILILGNEYRYGLHANLITRYLLVTEAAVVALFFYSWIKTHLRKSLSFLIKKLQMPKRDPMYSDADREQRPPLYTHLKF